MWTDRQGEAKGCFQQLYKCA